MKLITFPALTALCMVALAATFASAQDFGSLDAPPARNHQFIVYVAEAQVVPAGKRTELDLHFKVEGGYHVNSHTPKSELLIPTRVELQPAAGVKVDSAAYPAGKEYSFAFDPKEKLDVYADEFVVRVPVTVRAAGAYTLQGTLKYQACDRAACYPPKSLPITVLLNAVEARSKSR